MLNFCVAVQPENILCEAADGDQLHVKIGWCFMPHR